MLDVIEAPGKAWMWVRAIGVSVWQRPTARRYLVNGMMIMACTTVVVISQAYPAHAQSMQKLEQAVDKIVEFFTGKFGRGVGALAFIGMFLSAAFGLWSWGNFLKVGGAVAGVFASVEIVNFLSGG